LKVIMAPVEMVAKFKPNGDVIPARFAYDGKVIDVEQILSITEEKLAGNRMKIFSCQREINGELKRFDLKFELQTMKWFLWKM
jgi:predicted RNA-binding protein